MRTSGAEKRPAPTRRDFENTVCGRSKARSVNVRISVALYGWTRNSEHAKVNDVTTMEPNMDEPVRNSEVQLPQDQTGAAEETRPGSPAASPADTVPRVRVNFQVAAEVNPLLARDLMRFAPGKARHARLLTLMTLGLLGEMEMLSGDVPRQNSADANSEPGESGILKVLRRGGRH